MNLRAFAVSVDSFFALFETSRKINFRFNIILDQIGNRRSRSTKNKRNAKQGDNGLPYVIHPDGFICWHLEFFLKPRTLFIEVRLRHCNLAGYKLGWGLKRLLKLYRYKYFFIFLPFVQWSRLGKTFLFQWHSQSLSILKWGLLLAVFHSHFQIHFPRVDSQSTK